MKKLLSIIFFVIIASNCFAQLDNIIFKDSTFYPNSLVKKINYAIEVSPFFKNNEYFHASQDGQTYFGYQLQGAFFKKIGNKSMLTLGALAVQNYGSQNGISQWFPMVSLTHRHKNNTFMAGTLKGAAHHGLIEPLYAQELFYTHRNENGLQWLFNTKKSHLDVWMDWEVNTDRNVMRQEQFTAGVNALKNYDFGSKHLLSPMAQILYIHQGPSNGGSPDPLKTITNGALGLGYQFQKNNWTVKAKSYMLYYQDFSITKTNSFHDGYANYHHLQISPNKHIDLIVNYWNGTEYQAAKGGAIYQAVNPFDRSYPERKKQLLFARLHYHFFIDENLMLDLRLEPYFDLNQKIMESSYSVNMRYSLH